MPEPFDVRLATVRDAAVIARHRAEMFTDMGELPPGLYGELVAATMRYLEEAIPAEDYVGWLAAPRDSLQTIVAGAGLQRRRILPRHSRGRGEERVVKGRQGIVLNVFTEKPWRRKGLAELLMRRVIAWAGAAALDDLVLHASADGRRLYERLGFAATNEMRFTGRLRQAPEGPEEPERGESPP